MKRNFLLIASLVISQMIAGAEENPLWLRKSAISPDGTTVAFVYKGDIFTVSSAGGQALQITSDASYDSDPQWTADSRKIVFTSYREGSKDIYVTSSRGGKPTRITRLPGNESLLAVLPDGKVLFSWSDSGFMTDGFGGFPGTPSLYETDLGGKNPVLVTSLPVMSLSINAEGTVLYEDYKGYEDPLRKHHTSSVTRDIWRFDPAAANKKGGNGNALISPEGTFTRLTSFQGEDRQPVFAADGRTFYYLSEQDGSNINLFRSSLDTPGTAVKLTDETRNPVRNISVSKDGTILYSLGGELYTMREGSPARKLDISLYRDEKERELIRTTIRDARSIAISPDGEEIAFISRGDVYVTSVEYNTTRRITDTPTQERNVDFSKDGRSIFYSAERGGCWSIYKTSLTDKDDKLFTYATATKEEIVTTPGETCFQPRVSPDGKWIAFLRNRTELVIRDIKSGKEKSLHKDINYSYSDGDQEFEWSPDSQWILTTWQANGGWNNSDIAAVNIESGQIINLTESGYSDGNFRWALGGKAMTWQSDKNGFRSHGSWGAENDIYIMFFDNKAWSDFARTKEEKEFAKNLLTRKEQKAADKQEKKDSLDKAKDKIEKLDLIFEGREDRIRKLTRFSGRLGDFYLTDNGETLYFVQRLESSSDLCRLDIAEGNVSVVNKRVSGRLIPSKDGNYLFILSNGGISRIPTSGGSPKQISFSGEFDHRPAAEREYMFEHVWKQVKEKFYMTDLHGTDWDYYHDFYRQFLPHIDNNFDFADMLSEMLGELNGSHTGARYRYQNTVSLGHLGVIWDNSYTGDGARIREVLPGGVLSVADPEIKAGDILTAVEGKEIKAGDDWLSLLTDKAGKRIIITVKKGGKSEDIAVVPTHSDGGLLYKRWVRQREDMVARLSGGRIGYVHIEGMDSDSFREMYSKALGKYRNCEALIVDTRHNGGGWLHNDVVNFLGGKLYYQYIPRGQYIGDEPWAQWHKPSCMLIGEDNYSDASGTPYAYRQLGIGKLIGAPVPGTMTAVWWEYLIDSSLVFGIPEVGNWQVADQKFTENNQIEPDIPVYNDPVSMLTGRDLQLEAAVAEMLKTVDNK